jgi:transposase
MKIRGWILGDGHPGDFAQIVPQGAANASKLIASVEDPESGLPADAIPTLKVLIAPLAQLEAEIGRIDAEITRRARENEVARRPITVPCIGPLIATAIATLTSSREKFRKARDFAARLGLTPRQHSTGGAERLGATVCGGRAYRLDACMGGFGLHEGIGPGRAAVAPAPEPAVIVHAIRKTGDVFEPKPGAAT